MFRIICLLIIVLCAVVQDIRTYKIKNKLLLVSFIFGIFFLTINIGKVNCFSYLFGMLIPLIMLLPVFMIRALGAGDIKLFSVIGLYLGYKSVLHIILYSFLFGAVQSVIVLCINGNTIERVRGLSTYVNKIFKQEHQNYYEEQKDHNKSTIHFSVSILLALGFHLLRNWEG